MLLPAEISTYGQPTEWLCSPEPAGHAVFWMALIALSLAWLVRIGHGLGAVAFPVKNPDTRIGNAVRLLMENGCVRSFDQWCECSEGLGQAAGFARDLALRRGAYQPFL